MACVLLLLFSSIVDIQESLIHIHDSSLIQGSHLGKYTFSSLFIPNCKRTIDKRLWQVWYLVVSQSPQCASLHHDSGDTWYLHYQPHLVLFLTLVENILVVQSKTIVINIKTILFFVPNGCEYQSHFCHALRHNLNFYTSGPFVKKFL